MLLFALTLDVKTGAVMATNRVRPIAACAATAIFVTQALFLIRFPRGHQPWLWPDMGGEIANGQPNPAELSQGVADQNTYLLLSAGLFATALVAGLFWLNYAKRLQHALMVGAPILLGHMSVAGCLAWGSMWAIDSAIEDAGHFVGHAPNDVLHNLLSLSSFAAWPLFGIAASVVFLVGAITFRADTTTPSASA